jgi:sugar lactone lactonase YvrE
MRKVSGLALLVGALPVACGGGDETERARQPLSGDLITVVGDGTQGHDGDGHPLVESWLNQPMEIVFDAEDRATIVDWNNHSLRRVTAEDTLETVIGQPFPGDWPCQVQDDANNCDVPLDGSVPAVELSLNHPMDVAFDADGSLLIVAWHNHKIQRLVGDSVTVVTGQQVPGFAGDDGLAFDAALNFPDSVIIDSSGALLISDQRNNRVRRIDSTGTITTVVGATSPSDYAGDAGPAAECSLALSPYDEIGGSDNPPPGGGLALDTAGNLYLADSFNHCIRRIAPGADGLIGSGESSEETIETVAGVCGMSGYRGDGGPATEALLSQPHDVEIGPDGALYVADAKNNAVRRVDLDSGTIETIAGTGQPGFDEDVYQAAETRLRLPYGIAFDSQGVLFIVDTGNNRVRKVIQ